jgi:hypothetical protein
MKSLNTEKYIQAHDNLGRYRYPLSYDNRLAYVSLSAILAECINQRLGFNQIQEMLDEMTQNEINLLERLSK